MWADPVMVLGAGWVTGKARLRPEWSRRGGNGGIKWCVWARRGLLGRHLDQNNKRPSYYHKSGT